MSRKQSHPDLSPEELLRYGRQLVLPEVSVDGQRLLKGARVLCVGAGGLGSPLSMYLAAAGVGRLGLVDFDRVDLSNIQRQILYDTGDVGRSKLEAARARLSALNPNVEIVTHEAHLTGDNAAGIVDGYDIVADGTDNFATRYLVNDACVLAGKPNVQASVFRFEGQISLFDSRRGPCYRCLFPEPPPPGLVPSCAEGGVLGVLPGILGSLQALEVIKLILGTGETLLGRLLLFDALSLQFREVRVQKDPHCPVCGDSPTILGLMDSHPSCGRSGEARRTESTRPGSADAGGATDHADTDVTTGRGGAEGRDRAGAAGGRDSIEVEELRDRLRRGDPLRLIDVREPSEAAIARIEGSTLIPLGELADRLASLDRDAAYVVHCHTGIRSAYAAALMRREGFREVLNLVGGIDAWSVRVDLAVPRY